MLFLLGLTFGSFLAAWAYRLPRGIAITRGRSFCPRCRKQIAWFDNIPLLSFLFLGGRCRQCHKKISWAYPAIELATGIAFWLIGPQPLLLAIACFLLLVFVIDLKHQIIPDGLVFAGLVVSFLVVDISGGQVFSHILAGLTYALLLLAIHGVTRGRGMGLGDVKLVLFLGLYLGPLSSFISLLLASLTGSVVGIILILAGKMKFGKRIAFGPFLVTGFFGAITIGPKLLQYLR